MRFLFFILLSLCLIQPAQAAVSEHSKLSWQDFTDDLFIQAKQENRFVILDLEAIWCHWCHVMDQKTYADDAVIKILKQSYITVKVDQDSRPDLANRYRKYGWPATIIFAPDGTEIVKRAGYIAPENMRNLLQAIIDDPSPEALDDLAVTTKFSSTSSLSINLKKQLISAHQSAQDKKLGGLNTAQKYLDTDSVEYALLLAKQGNKDELAWAKLTMDNALSLIDPAWGGVYQYSTHGNWDNAHFEKIMSSQSSYMRIYALAYGQLNDVRYLNAAKDIASYIDRFLTSPQGAFYTSQDADIVQGEHSDDYFSLDSAQRLEQGIPKIDKHIYARENGWMIESLATLYEVNGNASDLEKAIRAANWINNHRRNNQGGYKHGEVNQGSPYLGDSLAMARANLHLYRVTAERKWLELSLQTALFIDANFKSSAAGYAAGKITNNPISAVPHIDENISLARFSNLLFHYTGDKKVKDISTHTLRYLATKEIALSRLTEAGILLADFEANNDPMHITILATKGDEKATPLFNSALQNTSWYKRIEWWDKKEGNLMNNNISYPQLSKSSAFVCNDGRCSLPLFTAEAITEILHDE